MELTVLIISYTSLSISVGASSAIALKEFSDLYFSFYKKIFNLYKYLNCFYYIFLCILSCRKNKEKKITDNKDKKQDEEKDSEKDKNSILEFFSENDEEKKENRKYFRFL